MATLDNVVAVVTGASRGLGLGIARALGAKGATVYLTGRASGSTAGANALKEAAEEVTAAGGSGIAIFCDHSNDEDVEKAFAQIAKESGRVDILVNNAAAVYQEDLVMPGSFWEKPLRLADMITVGERSNYVASYYAAPLMLENQRGLIVNVSFYGAVSYFHGAAYGAAKAGTDKMARDMAVDLKPHNIACVSIWPGFILTEELKAIPVEMLPPDLAQNLPNFETPEFTGLVIARLYNDPKRMEQSGKILIGAEMGLQYGIKDSDGKQPPSYREMMGSPNSAFEKSLEDLETL
jgi:NAD(P)-dependent dehydrogenase (short-subunit alcohol dehydrogenase family)